VIIKKFQAATEQEAIMMAKEEMGSNAVVLNIKTTKQRGLKRFFKKDVVEVTAALEEKQTTTSIPTKAVNTAVSEFMSEEEKTPNPIEERLDTLQFMLENKIQEMQNSEKEQEMSKKRIVIFPFLLWYTIRC
jgi:flagellar biosynthesis protein FlhF